jgi:hypothetical protein
MSFDLDSCSCKQDIVCAMIQNGALYIRVGDQYAELFLVTNLTALLIISANIAHIISL